MKKRTFSILILLLISLAWLPAQQNKGSLSNLVCLVRFADEDPSVFEKTAADYEQLFNASGNNDISIFNYFRKASYNQLNWNTVFYPAAAGTQLVSFQASHTRSYYTHSSSINPDGYNVDNQGDATLREQNLVKEISDYLNTIVPQTASLDANNDGTIDNICIILSGNSELSAKYMLWPHRSTLYMKSGSIAGKKVNEYILLFEGGNGWNSFNPIPLNAGVLCHEMSHTLGTRDLYHTAKGLNPIGIWDLMSDNQLVPQGMSAYTKYKYCKWIDDIPELTQPGTYSLYPVGGTIKNKLAYKIKLAGSDEYFVLEYRKNAAPFESSLPGSGLLVYRINPNFTGNEAYDGSSKLDEQYLFRPGGTVTADGTISQAFFSAESGRTAFGGAASVKPFYHDGAEAGFALANIGSCGDSITFDLLPFTPKLILSQSKLTLTGDAGSSSKIQLTAVNTAWELKSAPTWLTMSIRNGSAGTADLSITTLSKNETTTVRSGYIVLQSTTDTNVQVQLEVTQYSSVIQAPYGLSGTQDASGVHLSWKKPVEGSAVFTENFENTANQNLWTIQSPYNVGWVWQLSAKYKLPYEGSYSARLNTETTDRHQDERLISPDFTNGGRLFFYSNSIAPLKTNAHNFYYVEVSTDNGTTWNKVFDLKTQGTVVNKYEKVEVDLSAYASDHMKIAFHAYDDNNIGLSYWWHIDNIEIYPTIAVSSVKEYQIYRDGALIGTSATTNFTDATATGGAHLYKVLATGDFGETVFSNEYSVNVVTSTEEVQNAAIRIATTKETVRVSADENLQKVTMYNLQGKRMSQLKTAGSDINIDMKNIAHGAYILIVTTENNQSFRYKIIH